MVSPLVGEEKGRSAPHEELLSRLFSCMRGEEETLRRKLDGGKRCPIEKGQKEKKGGFPSLLGMNALLV